MECEKKTCDFVGLCYSDGSEICGPEIEFANCSLCTGGKLESRPHLISKNYPVLLV